MALRLMPWIAFLVALIEGFDLQAAGVAAPSLKSAFGLSPAALSLFFSAGTIGFAVGAIFGGRLADWLGRKLCLLVAIAGFGLCSAATAFAGSVDVLLLCRFATGIGLGAAMPILIAFTAEHSRPGRAASAVATLYAGMPTGGAIAAALTLSQLHGGWRDIFLVGSAAPIVIIPLLAWALPGDGPAMRAAAGPLPRGRWNALFGGDRLGVTLALWTAFFFTLLVLYLLLNWLPQLLQMRGFSKADGGLVQIGFNLAGAIGSYVTGRLVDRIGIATPVAILFGGIVVTIAGLAIAPAALVAVLVAASLAGAALMGAQALLYGLSPRLYPAAVRATGVGAAVSAGRLGSITGPLAAGLVVSLGLGVSGLLLAILPITLLGAVAALFLARRVRSVALTLG
jgi:AAHS family 3-hydroxyphenylpropionic acid transporter